MLVYMNLQEFNGPRPKPWLNIQAHTVVQDKGTADEFESNLLTLNNQVGVPNAPVNATSIWSSGLGNLSQTDDTGTTVTFAVGAPGDFLPRDGSLPMAGNLDMDGFQLSNLNNVTAIAGAVNFQDNIDMQTNELKNVSAIRVSSASGDVIIGNGAVTSNASGSVAIGNNCSGDFGGVAVGQDCIATFASVCVGTQCTSVQAADVCIGYQAKSIAIPGNSVSVGNSSSCSGRGVAVGDHAVSSADRGVAIGYFANASAANGISIGNASGASAASAIAIGSGAVNSIANSCVIGDSIIANIRPNNDSLCDLGSSLNRFNSLYSVSLRVKQGSNATSGTGATLVAGTVTVNTTAISTGDTVLLSRTAFGGVAGFEAVTAIVNATSFTITSSSVADTSTFSWLIIKQA